MKLFSLLLLLNIFTVVLAIPQNLRRAPTCSDECTSLCGCKCVFGNCNDIPYCPKVITPCIGTCIDKCSVICGNCVFVCDGCVGTPPLCETCTRVA